MMVIPIVFAYAIVKHRVMEFAVLVRRSARYVVRPARVRADSRSR